jgi:hypothetical protein
LNSPVPAGSRVTFFTGLKKVTKERTCAALGITFAVGGGFFHWYPRVEDYVSVDRPFAVFWVIGTVEDCNERMLLLN